MLSTSTHSCVGADIVTSAAFQKGNLQYTFCLEDYPIFDYDTFSDIENVSLKLLVVERALFKAKLMSGNIDTED